MKSKEVRALLEQRRAERAANDICLSKIDEEVRGLQNDEAGVKRLKELQTEVDSLQTRNAELESEIKGLQAQAERMEAAENARSGRVSLTPIEQSGRNPQENMTVEEARASEEYRRGWLRSVAVRAGVTGNIERMFGEMTEAEKRAFTFTTTNTGAPVPTITQNRIIDRLRHEAPMLDDATVTAIAECFQIPVRTEIAAGDASIMAQDAAAEDEQDAFDLITMVGVDIKKSSTMSRRMRFQSIDAFEDWLVADISKRIYVAKERLIIARLDGTAPASGEDVNNKVKIDAENVLTGQAYDDATIRNILSMIDEPGQVVVYANRGTIYNGLAGIQDANKRPLFITSTVTDDPMYKGMLYGAAVKEDVNLADNVAYFGVKGALKFNEFAPLEIFSTLQPKTANTIFTGTEICDAGLENPKAFVKVTFTPGE